MGWRGSSLRAFQEKGPHRQKEIRKSTCCVCRTLRILACGSSGIRGTVRHGGLAVLTQEKKFGLEDIGEPQRFSSGMH